MLKYCQNKGLAKTHTKEADFYEYRVGAVEP